MTEDIQSLLQRSIYLIMIIPNQNLSTQISLLWDFQKSTVLGIVYIALDRKFEDLRVNQCFNKVYRSIQKY